MSSNSIWKIKPDFLTIKSICTSSDILSNNILKYSAFKSEYSNKCLDSDSMYNLKDIYICSACLAYVQSNKFKKLLIYEPNPIIKKTYDYAENKCTVIYFDKSKQIFTNYNLNASYLNPITYTKCTICQRWINGILSGPDIIVFLINYIQFNQIKSTDQLLLILSKNSIWYYNDIYDEFGHDLKNKFKFSHNEIQNIYKTINNLVGLPSIEIINSKIHDIYNLLTKGIHDQLFNNYV